MRFLCVAAAALVLMMTAVAVAADQQLTLQQVIEKHLASIGTPEVRAAVKSRVAEGRSKFEILNAGGWFDGQATVVSEGQKTRLVMKYARPDYPGEDMVSDGNRIYVYGRPKRSAIAEFVYYQGSVLVTDGLLGGTLSTAWPLLEPNLRSAKLTYNGLKEIDGELVHEVRYRPRKSTDTDIRLYFGKDDFRHVRSIVSLTLSPRLLRNGGFLQFPDPTQKPIAASDDPDVANAEQQTIRYRLEERFSDFATFDGITLPTTCEIRYDEEGLYQAHHVYTNTFRDIVNNVPLDTRNFQIK